jgi:hypothetical protein
MGVAVMAGVVVKAGVLVGVGIRVLGERVQPADKVSETMRHISCCLYLGGVFFDIVSSIPGGKLILKHIRAEWYNRQENFKVRQL